MTRACASVVEARGSFSRGFFGRWFPASHCGHAARKDDAAQQRGHALAERDLWNNRLRLAEFR
jgi:hypothetical protein